MRYLRYLIPLIFVPPLLLGIAGHFFTRSKLDKMQQIRGWKPGSVVKTEVVHQKYENPKSGGCWVAFTGANIRQPGPHRMYVEAEKWDRLKIGDEIEVVYVPGDPDPYSRDGIYANDGNFEFDRGLLVVELAMIIFSLLGAAGSVGLLLFFDYRRLKKAYSFQRRH